MAYRVKQVCEIVGISYRQLDYWARTDLLRPSVADATGSGSQRLYSFHDLIELKVIKSLLDAGAKLESARTAITYLRDNLGEDLASAHLALQGSNSIIVKTEDEILDLVRKGQGVLNLVPLTMLEGEVHSAISAMPDIDAGPAAAAN
jgi:DNA-binding transcriptional MerR regulator